MCDSLGYISYGFDLAGIPLFSPDELPFPSYATNPYFPIGYPLILSFFILLFKKAFFIPVYIFQHSLIVFAQILFLKLMRNQQILSFLAFILFLLTPEFHIYPQSIMSEGPSISLHAILILSLLVLIEKDNKFYYSLFFISSVLLAMIRVMPFPVILATLGLLFIFKRIDIKRLIKLSIPVVLGIGMIPLLNLFIIGKPVLTASSGKHFHDRTIFSHQFPLIEGNKAQEKIISLIGEDAYRRPHWDVEGGLAAKGLDMGFEVDTLLKEASKPYFKLYPFEIAKKSLVFTWRTLSSTNEHEFGIPAKFKTDLMAIEHQIYYKPFGDLWTRYLKKFRINYISYLYLVSIVLVSIRIILSKQDRKNNLNLLFLSLYPLIGIFLSSCVSWDDPRRLREYILCMLILTLLGIHKSFQSRIES